MEPVFIIIAIIVFIPLIITLYEFWYFVVKGHFPEKGVGLLLSYFVTIVIYPFLYIGWATENNCCDESAAFSPNHVLSVLVLMVAYSASYYYSLFRTSLSSPLLEVLVNCFLFIGIVFNVFAGIQTDEIILATISNFPIMVLLLNMLIRNHLFIMREIAEPNPNDYGTFGRISLKVLYAPVFIKFPLLMILCLPIMVMLIAFLLLFGQKPDSFIRAFTDTYKHGFSQLNHECDNVQCGGHYLCSVAANGHTQIVKPERLGIRHGNPIICNRQLLVSNAFEELLQEKLPNMHRIIRHNYNKVGNMIHRHYGIFNNKYVSDVVYIIMKPAEWLFLLTLYTFDTKPENRIAMQYLKPEDRDLLKRK